MNDVLPNGWTWTTVGEIGKVKGGKRLPQGHTYSEEQTKYPYIRVVDFNNLTIATDNLKYLKEETQKLIKQYIISKEDVFISIAGSIGKVGVIPEHLDGANLTENAAKITDLNGLHNKYLAYVLSSQYCQEQIAALTISTNQPKLALFRIEKIKFPLPPLLEQERIVAKIEELFTQLEAGMSALERVQAGLRRYKASVLKAAVGGKLGIQNDEFRIGEGELLERWKLLTIEEACERIVDCLHSTPKFAEAGHFCVDSTWIKPGVFVFEKARFVDNTTFAERNRRMKPQENDVVFSREGALLGVAVRVPENFDFCLGQRMMIFRPQDFLDSKYLEFFLNSKAFRSQYAPLITGTASPHLNIGDIRKFTIPLPPLEEQRRIVAEVERRLSVAREVESSVEAALVRASRLRQAVLKSAFEGRLG